MVNATLSESMCSARRNSGYPIGLVGSENSSPPATSR